MREAVFSDARILAVDDEETNLLLLERLLAKAGYTSLKTTTFPEEVADMMSWDPDLILLDLQMPTMDGFAVLEHLQATLVARTYLPVLVLTADVTREAKERSLSLGARDFLTKPFDQTEVLLRIHNLLETRSLHLMLRDENVLLEQRVRERTAELWRSVVELEQTSEELLQAQQETIERLSLAAEFRDDETGRHIERMSRYAALLAQRVGFEERDVTSIRLASAMHDVGKIGIPDHILLKPGALTDDERVVMQRHAEFGHRILSGSRSQLLERAATIAFTHHERVDGGGYPRGLSGDLIPLEGRIAAIADVFDALTTDRVYRKAFDLVAAVDLMKKGRGTQFDARLLDEFLAALDEVVRIMEDDPTSSDT